MKNHITLCLIILAFPSCDPDPIPIDIPITPNPASDLDTNIIWKAPLSVDTTYGRSITNIAFYNNRIVTSYENNTNDEKLMCFDSDGQLQWTWDDYVPSNKRGRISDEGNTGNKFFFITPRENYCVDISTGNELWRQSNEGYGSRISFPFAGQMIKSIEVGSAPTRDSSYILTRDIHGGELKKVFSIKKTVSDGVAIPYVNSYISEIGDTILVFQNNSLYMPPNYKEVIDLYSYNLSTKQVMWHHKELKYIIN